MQPNLVVVFQLLYLARCADNWNGTKLEIQQNIIDDKPISMSAFFGDFSPSRTLQQSLNISAADSSQVAHVSNAHATPKVICRSAKDPLDFTGSSAKEVLDFNGSP